MKTVSRRIFIQESTKTALSASALMTFGASKTTLGEQNAFVYKSRMPVNPEIDNLSVVCGINPLMIKTDPQSWTMQAQNDPIQKESLEKTVDAMACTLSKKTETDLAWKTLLRKPQEKSWSNVKAAIKVNCIGKNHPRVALVNKICTELHKLGMSYENIIIYDGTHNAQELYAPFLGKTLSSGVIISNKNNSLGGTIKVDVPAPKAGLFTCAKAIADGTIDIIINIAVNKCHEFSLGKTTLTLKNHAGTFSPYPIHLGGGLDYVLAFNKSNAFWAGSVVRQQLCIVDSLWASANGGPHTIPDKRLNCIIMGTFSGAVDYLTAKQIREPLLGVSHGPIDRYLTEFGYDVKEIPDLKQVTV